MGSAVKGKKAEKKVKSARPVPTRKQLDELPSAVVASDVLKGLVGAKRVFDSGSTGYNINGKIVIGGLMHSVSCNIVAVGSKETK